MKKKRNELFSSRLMSSFLALLMVLQVFVPNSVAFAKESDTNEVEKAMVTLLETEHGSLSFDSSSDKDREFDKGSNITIRVNPDEGYKADVVSFTTESGETHDISVVDNKVNIPVIGRTIVTALFTEGEAQMSYSKVEEKDEKIVNEEKSNLNEAKKEVLESSEKDDRDGVKKSFDDSEVIAYILAHANKDLVGKGSNLMVKDVVSVANTMINTDKTKARNLNDFWKDRDGSGITDDFEALEHQSEGLVSLYEVSEDAKYLVAKPSILQSENSVLLQTLIGDSDTSGTVFKDVIYDKDTNLLYVPRNLILPKEKDSEGILKTRIGRVRAQFLFGISNEIRDNESEVDVVVDSKGVNGNVVKNGVAKVKTLSQYTSIQLANDEKSKKSIDLSTIDSIKINGENLDPELAEYDEEEGVLTIDGEPTNVNKIEVELSNSFGKTVKNVLGSILGAKKVYAAKPPSADVINSRLLFDKMPAVGNAWVIGSKNTYAGGEGNHPKVPSSFTKVFGNGTLKLGNQENNVIMQIINNSNINKDFYISPRFGFLRRAQVTKQTAKTYTASTPTMQVLDNFNLALYCAHIGINNEFRNEPNFQKGWDWSTDYDNYGFLARLVEIDGDTAIFGAVQPSQATQAGYGFFAAKFDVKPQEGQLKIKKMTNMNVGPLEGAEYGVYKNDAIVKTLTIGKDDWSNTVTLDAGDYIVKETKAPANYKLNPNSRTVTVVAEKTTSVVLDGDMIEQPDVGYLKLVKHSAHPDYIKNNSLYSLAGAEYKITGANGNGTLTTKSDGSTDTLKLPVGTYTVEETNPSAGHGLNKTPRTVTVSAGETNTVQMDGQYAEPVLNDPIALKIRKTVEGNYRGSLAGIRFKLTHYAGLYNTAAEAKASKTETASAVFETDKNGYIDARSFSPVKGSWKYKNKTGNTAPIGTLV